MGIHTWIVNTVQLPWHPGHGLATRMIPQDAQFESYLQDLAAAPWRGEVGAILSGYLATPAQAAAIAGLVKTIREANPEVLYVCDPVIGDESGLYVSPEVANAIRSELISICDIATPNRYELEWFAGKGKSESQSELVQGARALGPATVLVTSAPGMMAGNIANLVISGHSAEMAEHREIANAPNGPGDLTAALYLGHVLAGKSGRQALQQTTASVFEIVSRAGARKSEELMLETDAHSILQPRSQVMTRTLGD